MATEAEAAREARAKVNKRQPGHHKQTKPNQTEPNKIKQNKTPENQTKPNQTKSNHIKQSICEPICTKVKHYT